MAPYYFFQYIKSVEKGRNGGKEARRRGKRKQVDMAGDMKAPTIPSGPYRTPKTNGRVSIGRGGNAAPQAIPYTVESRRAEELLPRPHIALEIERHTLAQVFHKALAFGVGLGTFGAFGLDLRHLCRDRHLVRDIRGCVLDLIIRR